MEEKREETELTAPLGSEGETAEQREELPIGGEEESDFARMAEEDLAEVKALIPTLSGLTHLGGMPEAARFGELREMGLSVKETLGALGLLGARETRAHLRSSVPRRMGSEAPRMSYGELAEAKRLFPDMGEREIARLYRRVNA